MPALASLVINDGAATPVAHTFAPVTTDGSLAKWADRSPSIASGFRTLSQEVLAPSGNRTAWKVSFGFYFPTVATVNSVDQVVRFQSGSLVLNFSPDSTVQERDDSLSYVINMLSHANVRASVENLEPHY